MAVSCTPADLAEAAKCFVCLDEGQKEAIKLYLLAVIAGGSTDPAELMADAACFVCLDEGQKKAINTYLLCQAANGGAAPTDCEALSGANSPDGAVTPDFTGQLYHETGDDTYWRSTGLTNADWVEISGVADVIFGPNPTTLNSLNVSGSQFADKETFVFPRLESVTGASGLTFSVSPATSVSFPALESSTFKVQFSGHANLVTAEFPSLLTVGTDLKFNACLDLTSLDIPTLTSVGGSVIGGSCASLVTVDFSSLETVGTDFNLPTCPALTSLDTSSLETVGGGFNLDVNISLETVSLPVLTSTGGQFSIFGCSLLTTFSAPNLVSTGGSIAGGETGLVSLSLPSLTTATALYFSLAAVLENVSLPVWTPPDGSEVYFDGCALTATSVNHILARCIANAGFTTGTVDLTGGTNAAPTGQGITDKADLITRGVTVNTN